MPTKNPNFQTRLFKGASRYYVAARSKITRRRVGYVALGIFLILLILPIATYAYYAGDIANKEKLMNRNDTGIILTDRTGKVFFSSGVLSSHQSLPLSKISDNVQKAVVASEDKDFYTNIGFSFRGTARALLDNITHHDASRSGGSTITQQLVKNKLLGSQKNYLRKYQEIAMSVAVERRYSKQEILDMYLNSAYFGDGAFGISDASHIYFGKNASDLNLAESSMLIGLLPAPTSYSPITGSPEKAKAAQKNVLRKMVATHVISDQQRDAALATTLTYSNDAKKGGSDYAQHFADMVIKQVEDQYGEERVKRSGFHITTTLDLSKQKTAEAVVKKQVALDASRGGRNAGLVTIDPKTGQVLALVGSVDYYNKEFGQVNMATALRQPGSSFKPIYYSDAIDRGLITAATILDDSATTFGNHYAPKDYDNRFKGKMAVRNALAESRNVPAVEVMQKEGVQNAVNAAQRMGLDHVNNPSKYGLSLALGTAEVELLHSTSAYGAFANQGQHFSPVLYTKITDKYNKTVANVKPAKPKKVLSPDAAYIINSILSDTSARAPTYGTTLNIPHKTVALKTGTTNDNRDAWTIGYTPSIVTGVWLGNNQHEPMQGLAGGSGAGVIWKQVMTSYLSSMPNESFNKPASIVTMTICNGTDQKALHGGSGTHTEYFKPGTAPTETCGASNAPKPDTTYKKQENQDEKPQPEDQKPQPAPTNTQPTTQTAPTTTTNQTSPQTNDTTQNGTQPTDPTTTPTNGSGSGGDSTTPTSGSTTTNP